jgi:hypothetical protein
VALEQQSFPDPWPEDSLAQVVEGPGTLVLIAAESYSAPPLGYAANRAVGGEAELLRLAVAPAARRPPPPRRPRLRSVLPRGPRRQRRRHRPLQSQGLPSHRTAPGYYGRGFDAVVYAGSTRPGLLRGCSLQGHGHRSVPPAVTVPDPRSSIGVAGRRRPRRRRPLHRPGRARSSFTQGTQVQENQF